MIKEKKGNQKNFDCRIQTLKQKIENKRNTGERRQ